MRRRPSDRVCQEEVFGRSSRSPPSRTRRGDRHRQRHRIRPGRRAVDHAICSARTASPSACRPAWSGSTATSASTRARPSAASGQSGYGREMGFEAMREYTHGQVGLGQRRCADPAVLSAPEGAPRCCPFVYDARQARHFGVGALDRLPRRSAARRRPRAGALARRSRRWPSASRRLGELAAASSPKPVMHVPIETARAARVTRRTPGRRLLRRDRRRLDHRARQGDRAGSGLPIIAMPTTYAGSEMTPIYGLTEGGLKKTGRDRKVLPRTVLYDPDLTVTLPTSLSATSGMNAIAHGVEALYAPDRNPITSLIADEGIRALARALPIVVKNRATSRRGRMRSTGPGWGDRCWARSRWPSSQALPYLGRQLQPAACRGAHRHPAACGRLQSRRRAGSDAGDRRGARGRGCAAGPLGSRPAHRRAGCSKDIGMPEDGLDRAAELATQKILTTIRGRSIMPASDSCSTTPIAASALGDERRASREPFSILNQGREA